MHHASALFASLGLVFLVACSGSVESQNAAGTASGSGGNGGNGGSSSFSSSGVGSAGGGGPGGSSVSSVSSSSSGQGGSGGCGTIDFTEDNGPIEHLTSVCADSWGAMESSVAVGYLFQGGFANLTNFHIEGCSSQAPQAHGIHLVIDGPASTGHYSMGTTSYVDSNGVSWGDQLDPPIDVTITKLDPVGGVVEGDFKVIVTHGGNAAHTLDGKFSVCRVSDLLAP